MRQFRLSSHFFARPIKRTTSPTLRLSKSASEKGAVLPPHSGAVCRFAALFRRNAAVRHSRQVAKRVPDLVCGNSVSGNSRPQTLQVLVSIVNFDFALAVPLLCESSESTEAHCRDCDKIDAHLDPLRHRALVVAEDKQYSHDAREQQDVQDAEAPFCQCFHICRFLICPWKGRLFSRTGAHNLSYIKLSSRAKPCLILAFAAATGLEPASRATIKDREAVPRLRHTPPPFLY